MTIMDNEQCFQELCLRSQKDRILTNLMQAHLPYGIPSDMMCATGFYDPGLKKFTVKTTLDIQGPPKTQYRHELDFK